MKYLVFVFIAIIALLSTPTVKAQASYCSICEFVAGYAENALGPKINSTIVQVEKELLFFCSLSGKEQQACETIVQEYYSEIVSAIAKDDDPLKVCTYAGLCGLSSDSSLSSESSESSESEPSLKIAKRDEGDIKCALCSFLVEQIDNYISGSSTEEQIIDLIQDACSKLSGLADTCEALVEQYAEVIFNMIIKKEDPSQICSKLKLCSGSSSSNDNTSFRYNKQN